MTQSITPEVIAEIAARHELADNGDMEGEDWDTYVAFEDAHADRATLLLALAEAQAKIPALGDETAEDEAYKLGVRDGYQEAVQDIDLRTGGDGEYRWSTDPERSVPDPAEMIKRIVARLTEAQERAERAEAALKPFAAFALPRDFPQTDDRPVYGLDDTILTLGHFRRAAQTLKERNDG